MLRALELGPVCPLRAFTSVRLDFHGRVRDFAFASFLLALLLLWLPDRTRQNRASSKLNLCCLVPAELRRGLLKFNLTIVMNHRNGNSNIELRIDTPSPL